MELLNYLTLVDDGGTDNLHRPGNLRIDLNGEEGKLKLEVYINSQVELIDENNVDDNDEPVELRTRISWTAPQ
jgi:hypothetical protein